MPFIRTFFYYGYFPLVLVGFNATALALLALGYPALTLAPLLLAAIGLSFLAERIIPYSRDWSHDHQDSGRDIAHAAVNESASFLSVLSIPTLAALIPWTGFWPVAWPFWLQVLLAILVADFGITLAHYFSHRLDVLWRLHAVHHSVKRMYGFNGLMKHPVHQAIETVAGTTPLLLAGMPQDVAFGLAFAVAVQLLLQHANADFRIGPLKYLLAVNAVHRFHHIKWPREGDVNFGLFTTIWDRILGTFHYEPSRSFSSNDLGIGAEPDYPNGYLAQLIRPFRRRPSSGAYTEP